MLFLVGTTFVWSCSEVHNSGSDSNSESRLFETISSNESGIDFQNHLVETEQSNYYKYMYSYIGAGVASADFNNDGLIDLFFVSNQGDNKLYLNKGGLKFEDISEKAGIQKRKGFDAGVAIVDVNNDGWLDIYITRGGWIQDDNAFANMLYINKGIDEISGIPTFTEEAISHGLADANRSIHSTFFDYDLDGDLDVYISNTPDFDDPASEILDLITVQKDPQTEDQKGSDKLYQNQGDGKFIDVSYAAGILPEIGFGLNPQVGDLNNDGWPDIYVCNDFRIPDFVYINDGKGGFKEGRNDLFKHMSFNSMGGDIADVNNDGFLDLYTLDMNPQDYIRSKTTMGMTSQSRFEEMVAKDYHHQYMHNMLQINNGNGSYREVSKMSGIADTDWSWSCLLADFDLDGYNDVFVTNGVYRDVIDRDANNNIIKQLREKGRKPSDADFLSYAKMLPQQKLTNYIFKNNGDLTFEDMSSAWVGSEPTFSNGATYADLDNDGDLELIVNNINQEATILKNNATERSIGKYLQVKLKGSAQNLEGIGATVKVHTAKQEVLTRQLIRSRGFLSSVSGILHFGLSTEDSISKLEIFWPDGKYQSLTNIEVNQRLQVDYKNAIEQQEVKPKGEMTFEEIAIDYHHEDPSFDDYSLQILLPHKLSQLGPALAAADVNNDGLEDLYIGGGHTQAGQLLISQGNGKFKPLDVKTFRRDKQKEDVDAIFFDADADGDQDLYVVSGSYEFRDQSRPLLDRLYINDGRGNFSKSQGIIPDIASSGSVVRPGDFDNDGDLDLFVGGRVINGKYPYPARSYFLLNEGGVFRDMTSSVAPDLANAGMVTDAQWTDIDSDEDLDLVITGEWMPIVVFKNENNQLIKSDTESVLGTSTGWWNRIVMADVDQDGDEDIIAGNLGLNYKFHASPEKPFHVYTKDFDFNGTYDIFLAKYYNDVEVPVRGKTCASQQMPHLANKIPTYNDFASKNLEGILGPGIKSALHYTVTEFRSGIFYNEGNGAFKFQPFSNEAQQFPVNSILFDDFDGDEVADIVLAGNNHMSEIETTKADAGIGVFYKGNSDGTYVAKSHLQTGFFANRDVRKMVKIATRQNDLIVVANNNDQHQIFKVNEKSPL